VAEVAEFVQPAGLRRAVDDRGTRLDVGPLEPRKDTSPVTRLYVCGKKNPGLAMSAISENKTSRMS
jgi:hypothetical protein